MSNSVRSASGQTPAYLGTAPQQQASSAQASSQQQTPAQQAPAAPQPAPNWFGPRNTILPLFDSAGCTLFSMNSLKAVPSVGNAMGEANYSETYFMNRSTSSGYFREVFLLSWAAAGWNAIEAIFWLAIGAIAFLFGKYDALQEAMRCTVKMVSNVFFTMAGAIGMISPRHAYTFVGWASGYVMVAVMAAFNGEATTLFIAEKALGLFVGVQAISATMMGETQRRAFDSRFTQMRNSQEYQAIARGTHNPAELQAAGALVMNLFQNAGGGIAETLQQMAQPGQQQAQANAAHQQ